jgi:hypothetical protein
MSSRRTALDGAVALLVAGVIVGGACVPSDPVGSGDAMVRRTAEGAIEARPCTSQRIETLAFGRVRNPGGDQREDDVIWELEFEPSSRVDGIVLGEDPGDADVVVPWTPELVVDAPDTRFVVNFSDDESNSWIQSFRLSDLDGDVVLVGERTMTDAEFERSDECE